LFLSTKFPETELQYRLGSYRGFPRYRLGSYRGFPRWAPHGTGLAMVNQVESSCCASGAQAGFKKQKHEGCQHCFRGCRRGRKVSLSVFRPYTVHCNKSVCMAVISSQKEVLERLQFSDNYRKHIFDMFT